MRRTHAPGEVETLTAATLQKTLPLQQTLSGRCHCTGLPRKDKQGMAGFDGIQVVQTKYLVIAVYVLVLKGTQFNRQFSLTRKRKHSECVQAMTQNKIS